MEIQTILEQKQRLYRDTVSKTKTNNSIELTEKIDNLIDNKMYRNKFKKLVREGHLADLEMLADLAADKEHPSHWFARVTSKARWEGTLKWLAKVREVMRAAAEVAQRIAVPANGMKAVYKACWKLNQGVIRHAVTAAETGKDPYKLFTWLCWHT